MTILDDITNVLQLGGCVVMGIGVAPERYRLLLEGATNQDYMIIGKKDSADAKFIVLKMSGEQLSPKSITVAGLEIEIYLISGNEQFRQNQ